MLEWKRHSDKNAPLCSILYTASGKSNQYAIRSRSPGKRPFFIYLNGTYTAYAYTVHQAKRECEAIEQWSIKTQ